MLEKLLEMDCLQVHENLQSSLKFLKLMSKNIRCTIGTIKTIKYFVKPSFIIHPQESSFQPLQEITSPGFVFN